MNSNRDDKAEMKIGDCGDHFDCYNTYKLGPPSLGRGAVTHPLRSVLNLTVSHDVANHKLSKDELAVASE